MKISKQAKQDAKRLFAGCRVKGVLDDQRVRQAVTQVIAKRPRGCLAILSHFVRLVRLDVDRRTARVESAVKSPPPMMESIKTNLARRYGPGLDVRFDERAELIGGIRIRIGSDVYDGSIQARLAQLESGF